MDLQLHIVQSGQTLYSIGRQYGLAPGLIARYNGLHEPYRLAAGQCLLILKPGAVYTVRPGDTLYTIARRFGTDVRTLWRDDPNLSGGTTIYPGQTIVLQLESARTRPVQVLGYAYPAVRERVLRGILPYAATLCPFTYGIASDGTLARPNDAALVQLAREYGTDAYLHLSTRTEEGVFSAARAEAVLESPVLSQRLIDETVRQMQRGGYRGVDVDFEFLGAALAGAFAGFLGRLRAAVNAAGGMLLTALAPKTSAAQRGALYEGHSYPRIAENSDLVLLMTYGWMIFAHKYLYIFVEKSFRDNYAKQALAAPRIVTNITHFPVRGLPFPDRTASHTHPQSGSKYQRAACRERRPSG